MVEPLRIPARGDGYSLSAGLFVPRGPPKAAALIAGAMAVRASFYAPFARYLADQGLAALTLDYRGIGGSRPQGSLRGFHATFHDWGARARGGALRRVGDGVLEQLPRPGAGSHGIALVRGAAPAAGRSRVSPHAAVPAGRRRPGGRRARVDALGTRSPVRLQLRG